MSLMDKFSTVEIKADNRISEEDKAFCQRHQDAFDKSGPALQKIADLMIFYRTEQREALAVDDDHFHNPYMVGEGFHCDPNYVYEIMKKRNKEFVDSIVRYFASKYHVELSAHDIAKHLIPEAPKEPDFPRYEWKHMTEEEQNAYKASLDSFKEAKEVWELSLRTLPLRYERIVDEIFVQLGGFSFQEQAMNEFYERVWNCCHQSWDEHKEKFEIKNDILRLSPHSCWLCVDENKWMNNPIPDYKPQDDLHVLAEALAHYECGRTREGHLWYPELCAYSTKDNAFICHHKYVASIKFFKNSRVDIKFRSAAYAQEFVEQYLRRKLV